MVRSWEYGNRVPVPCRRSCRLDDEVKTLGTPIVAGEPHQKLCLLDPSGGIDSLKPLVRSVQGLLKTHCQYYCISDCNEDSGTFAGIMYRGF
jgi:hypothetical protein